MKIKLKGERIIHGGAICGGVAIGKPFVFSSLEGRIPKKAVSAKDIENEVARYYKALSDTRSELIDLRKSLKREKILEGVAILDTHLQMLVDPGISDRMEEKIRARRLNAEYLFQQAIQEYRKRFNKITEPFFRERLREFFDLSKRILRHLLSDVRVSLLDVPKGAIVFTDHLIASDVAEAGKGCLAFVTKSGGSTSHAAIIARGKGIPVISNVVYEEMEVMTSENIIVDGRVGTVIFAPTQEEIKKYRALSKKLRDRQKELAENRTLVAETMDGKRIMLMANVDSLDEADTVVAAGGDGIGLFRTEGLVLATAQFPTEEQQTEIYRALLQKMGRRPVVIRAFDFGGDKKLVREQISRDEHSFLGCRAIRFLLKEQAIFHTQLRAVLRGSDGRGVRLLLPMISTVSELVQAKECLERAKRELKKQGISFGAVELGAMIEVPAAVMIADELAHYCDFLSLGTNDLVQYALALDRGHLTNETKTASVHPSVLRFIKLADGAAKKAGKSLSLCGETASDPRFTQLLLGLGVEEFSVSARMLPAIKHVVRKLKLSDCRQLTKQIESLHHPDEIYRLLEDEYRKTVPEDAYYNC